MILSLSVRFRKSIALLLLGIFYAEMILAAHRLRDAYATDIPTVHFLDPGKKGKKTSPKHPLLINGVPKAELPMAQQIRKAPMTGGPSQPEMKAFTSVGAKDMVDLFTGDFSYNIPLLDVGGYPVNIAYHSGRTPDEDASWVGLGWNINPGSITREVRGLPDDFDGGADTVRKVEHINPNKSFGITAGADWELFGLPLNLGGSLGIFHNTYNGWGLETGLNASISTGEKSSGNLSGGLSISNNSQNGITISPSLSANLKAKEVSDKADGGFGLSFSAAYNSRSGLRDVQLGMHTYTTVLDDKGNGGPSNLTDFAGLTFAWSTYTPTMTMPLTNYNETFTAKVGTELDGGHPSFFLSAYFGKEYIADPDTTLSLPAYGYLNFQNQGSNWAALTDFNREKETPYRENPPVPHIAIPAYTYDVFSVSGEGTGGEFRAYRGDIGFIADHLIKSKTSSDALSVDLGIPDLVHGGVDLNANYSVTQSGPWLSENTLKSAIGFQSSNGLYESAYFRNPGEKATNTKSFYNAMGCDDVVTPVLYQPGNSGPSIIATDYLARSRGQKPTGTDTLNSSNAIRTSRDKRSQVISYLTASQAAVAGLDKYIYHYGVNQFGLRYCVNDSTPDTDTPGTGLTGYYYKSMDLSGTPVHIRNDSIVWFNWSSANPFNTPVGEIFARNVSDISFGAGNYSVRWLGRLMAPVSGSYGIGIISDDGVRLWLNDTLIISNWTNHATHTDTANVNLVAGKIYSIRMEYYQAGGDNLAMLMWRLPYNHYFLGVNHDEYHIPGRYLFPPLANDTSQINPIVTQEERVNTFRKPNHLSEIDVLNADGRRYVYGIPVYNLSQKDVSFSIPAQGYDLQHGLVWYDSTRDNSTLNSNGQDGYYSREELPAYAHSFLLTGILSPDYVDVTGDGISDDDIGDAVRFNYTKVSGIANPFGWRAPYIADSANYNEGLRSYNRDDKAHYIYGTKELWYLNSIESKTMIATFTLQHRSDLLAANEQGNKVDSSKAMCLKQIDLYSKADFLAHGANAIPIKTVHFVYDYELCRGINRPVNDSGKLTLKQIWFSYNGNNKGTLNPYVFIYHPNNPMYNTNMTDKWGTYKDPATNPDATTGNPINNAEYPYALQDSTTAAYNAGAWMLDSIQLPSGGAIKVNYESDDYAYTQNLRSTQMCNVIGFGTDGSGHMVRNMYGVLGDNLYAYIRVPYQPASLSDLYARYLDGIGKMYFRLYVPMPNTDEFGTGSEYIPCYADLDTTGGGWYGTTSDPTVIWVRMKGVNKSASGDGNLSPLAQTAINFLRLNLPSKAYPGSQVNDNLDVKAVAEILVSEVGNIVDLLNGFSNTARLQNWVNVIDTTRSFARLDCPTYKKYGGGLRVKSILIYDSWNTMTGQKQTVYGQTYDYTMTQVVNGDSLSISSGVASWEPNIGGEENPFHLPIEYVDRASVLAPAATLYTEEPLGESFYPGASVGYRQVRIRSIHTTGTRSANGYAESTFYTTYDFPTSWDWSVLDNNSKKRYKPLLNNFLRINAMNYLTLSQGFKVELNDMNGKPRTEASYAETDSLHPINYTEYFYKVVNQSAASKKLCNTVMTIDPLGNIDTAATVGKDAEIMTDMREQTTSITGGNLNVNTDLFLAGVWPLAVPTLLNLFQHETTRFRSAAMTKVITRYGILDSVVHIDKGSQISTKNLLYDAETGDPVLTRTQNEFNDPVYNFSYPTHWAYKGMGPAYQNIGAVLTNLTIANGKITAGLTQPDSTYLTGGDEILAYSHPLIPYGDTNFVATFPDAFNLTVVDTNIEHGGPPALFLVNNYGNPFSGNEVTLMVTRSGHRNINGSLGAVESLVNPLVYNSGTYQLQLDSNKEVVNASANLLQQIWQVEDKHRSNVTTTCVATNQDSAAAQQESCSCLQPLISYLISHRALFIPKAFHTTVASLIAAANGAGAHIDTSTCPILESNYYNSFYALTFDTLASKYEIAIGNDVVDLLSASGYALPLYSLTSNFCDSSGTAWFKNPGLTMGAPDTVTVTLTPSFSVNLFTSMGDCPFYQDTLLGVDDTSRDLLTENNLSLLGAQRNALSVLQFNQLLSVIPTYANILSAKMILQADSSGHYPPFLDSANSVNPTDSLALAVSPPQGWFPYYPYDTLLYQAFNSPWYTTIANLSPFQNDTVNITPYISGYVGQGGLGTYNSDNFILTQGSGNLHAWKAPWVNPVGVPPYLLSGYSNYYATFYSQRDPDTAKWPVIQVTYVLPGAWADTAGAYLSYRSTMSCTRVVGRSCFSSITDTLVNPYHYGILGDNRPLANYVYYTRRKESDPTAATNIRVNGTISGFMPFWTLQSGVWFPSSDSSRWVWNTQTTLYNRKGFEIENKDPLGRYNSGLYGYGETLPTAVTQNSPYQETAFEGFEDYGFIANTCDTGCTVPRPFDFTPYASYISDSAAHTGIYSLRVPKAAAVIMDVPIQAAPGSPGVTLTDTTSMGTLFDGIKAASSTLLPPFEPYAGQKMLFSAWVKENDSCACQQYTSDHITIILRESSGDSVVYTLSPSGNMIEGWQRYETAVQVPGNANQMVMTLQASASATTYFDDIRMHPFNADMKSYVYNPNNLRLMAELDENNYATFYEYDDDGTLIRVKKETERGILTIKETRSALLKIY
jgi:hypothetical protein